MDSFVEKFNIFDLFTMLIPGIIISTLFSISLSFRYKDLWENAGNEKYVLFFVFSYLCGVVFQELGTIADKKFLNNILYGGNPREIYLLKNGHERILNEEAFYNNVLLIRDFFAKKFDIKDIETINIKDEKELNSLVFGYCLNLLESKKLTGKADKMIVISEMSRSLFWGCIATIILNLYMIFKYSYLYHFYYLEMLFLIILSFIFISRKVRYEKYRIRILLRTVLLFLK